MGQAAEGAEGVSARAFARELFGSRACLLSIAAIALSNLAVQLMNRSLFPLFDEVLPAARDVSIALAGAVCISVGLVSLMKPSLLRGRALALGFLAAMAAGAALLAFGVRAAAPAALLAGACLFVPARSWAMLSANLSAVELPPRFALASLACGVAAGQALDAAVRAAAPQEACAVVMALAAAASLLLSARPVSALVDRIGSSEPMADIAVTRPASYVPLTHGIYVCLIIVQTAFGFALRFGEVEGAPAFGSLSALLVALVAVLAVALRGRLFVDELADVVMLALMAGLLLVAVGPADYAVVASSLLAVGASLFNVLMYAVLLALAGRNRLAGLSIMGWGAGLACFATTAGALLGRAANGLAASGGARALSMLAALAALLLVAYILFGMRRLSFKETIEGVESPVASGAAEAGQPAQPATVDDLAGRCHELAARYGLTPREEETFAMLARGRNREYIEGALCVSRNTVKAHVKHVYAKLGIHSHQELLDLVEGSSPAPAPAAA